MLQEREIKQFIHNHHTQKILKIIPQSFNSTLKRLSLAISIDLTKTIRQNHSIGLFIIGNYQKFVQLFEQCVGECMFEQNLSVPQNGISVSFSLVNCPLLRHNFESVQFLSAAFEQKEGVLVYIKQGLVVQVGQSQLYLGGWVQMWVLECGCSGQVVEIKKKQSLINILNSHQHIRAARVPEQPPRCQHCSSKMRLAAIKEQNFVNCQQITILMNINECQSNLLNSEQIFHKGEFKIYLDESNTDKLLEGDIIDLCCYYTAWPEIAKIDGQKMTLRCINHFYMVCYYPQSCFSASSNLFFTNLVGLGCEYIQCREAYDCQTICYNYKNLLKTINSVTFPYLAENSLSTIKLIVLNSLFNQAHKVALHILILTDEVFLIHKSLNLHGLFIKNWPTFYDQITLIKFINTCHNAIIIVANPTKRDREQISIILNNPHYQQLNFTLWIVAEPNTHLKKQLNLERIGVVMDLTSEKNMNVCRSVFDAMLDQKLQKCMSKEDVLSTVQKAKGDLQRNEYEFEGMVFEGIESNEQEILEQNKIAQSILQKYFIKARQYKHIGSNSLTNIKHLTQGFSHLRNYLKSKGSFETKGKVMINILDSVLAIFIQEETSRNKFLSSNTLFSNEISKVLLNESDCELSFWQWEVDEAQEIGERKRMIKKEEMFKRMVQKLMNLLFKDEMS